MAVNLCTKYGDKLAELYTTQSFIKGKTSTQWRWDGARNVEILSIVTQDLQDYNRTGTSNRYGTPAELQDNMQKIEIAQDKSFSIVIDKGNNTQQGMLKRAGEVLREEIGTKVVPAIDKYALKIFARFAGNVVAASAALSASNIVSYLCAIEDKMSDELVPMEGRFCAMANSTVSLFRQALTNCDTITDKLLLKGLAGRFGTLNIVGVPSSWLPTDTVAVAWHKDAVVIPEQINDAKVHQDPQGFSGNVLEGRYLFDAAVVGAKCGGVYALVNSGKKCSTSVAISTNTATITAGNADAAYYTVDGTDPRYSKTRTYWTSGTITITAGTIKVVGIKTDGSYGSSDVASATHQ